MLSGDASLRRALATHADELELRHEGGAADVALVWRPPDADAPPLRIATLDRVRLRSILLMLLASRRPPDAPAETADADVPF